LASSSFGTPLIGVVNAFVKLVVTLLTLPLAILTLCLLMWRCALPAMPFVTSSAQRPAL